MSLVQNDGSQDLQIKTVYYAGTSTLKQGNAVVYDTDDTNAPVTTTTLDRKNLRGRRVVNPATATLGGFAGLVAPQSAGIVGPAYIDIIVPRKGDMCFGFTNVNCTKNSSLLGITNAGAGTLVTIADATVNLDLVAIAMETVDRSSTNGLVLLRFL
jgi:hypothetical protein